MQAEDRRAVARLSTLFLVIAGLFLWCEPLQPQLKYDSFQKERVRQMLRQVADALRKHYYDPTFHGLDMEARYKIAEERIQRSEHLAQGFQAIAGALEPLNDSHTHFFPPSRPVHFEYGYVLQMIGDRCFIVQVRPNSDAAAKLKPGDEVLEIEGFRPTRDSLWKMNYFFGRLSPRPAMHLALRSLDGSERKVEVAAKVRSDKIVMDLTGSGGGADIWKLIRESETAEHLLRQRYVELGDKLLAWKMPEFDLSDDEVDRMFGRARKHAALILDLRGNPGGLVKTLERVVRATFDHDVVIAKRVGRKADLKPQLAKGFGSSAFAGKLIVLVDSRSASAAELFARVVQLEKRGIVLGDLSSGSVMESRYYPLEQGMDSKIFYGISVTDADLIMSDGKSLEHNGVAPDELILPSAADLAAGRDPVLARAAELAGVHLEPAEAGKLFLYEWSRN